MLDLPWPEVQAIFADLLGEPIAPDAPACERLRLVEEAIARIRRNALAYADLRRCHADLIIEQIGLLEREATVLRSAVTFARGDAPMDKAARNRLIQAAHIASGLSANAFAEAHKEEYRRRFKIEPAQVRRIVSACTPSNAQLMRNTD